jgi:hypothetical protein
VSEEFEAATEGLGDDRRPFQAVDAQTPSASGKVSALGPNRTSAP